MVWFMVSQAPPDNLLLITLFKLCVSRVQIFANVRKFVVLIQNAFANFEGRGRENKAAFTIS